MQSFNVIEEKEVDLEKEIQDHIRECLDVKFPTTDIELIKKDVEYTRTDAFIEKAQSFFRQSHYLFCLDGMDLHNFIEDFKKYMED